MLEPCLDTNIQSRIPSFLNGLDYSVLVQPLNLQSLSKPSVSRKSVLSVIALARPLPPRTSHLLPEILSGTPAILCVTPSQGQVSPLLEGLIQSGEMVELKRYR